MSSIWNAWALWSSKQLITISDCVLVSEQEVDFAFQFRLMDFPSFVLTHFCSLAYVLSCAAIGLAQSSSVVFQNDYSPLFLKDVVHDSYIHTISLS